MFALVQLVQTHPPGAPAVTVSQRLIHAHGTSLIDALVAAAIVVIVTAGVAHLLVWGRRATWSAGTKSMAVALATQKMERLRSLTWEFDADGTPISDETTDLSAEPPRSTGTGLQPSPAGTLSTNTPGFVDYIDVAGQWCGNAAQPPGGAAFVRRWSVEAFTADAANTIILTVLVLPLADLASAADHRERGVRLTTIRTRVER